MGELHLMAHPSDTTEHPIRRIIQVSSWLGVGIWTLSFTATYLQLWLR
jgi:hypothetical protein